MIKVQPSGILLAFLCLLVLSPFTAKSQHELYLTGGIELAGANYGYQFQQRGSILQDQFQMLSNYNDEKFTTGGICFNFNIGFQYQVSERVLLEMGYSLSEIDLLVHDEYFQERNGVYGRPPMHNTSGALADNGNFDFAKWYHGLYASGYYFFRDQQKKMRPYLNMGVNYHFYSPGSRDIPGSYFHQATDENLVMTSHFNSNYLGGMLELGVKLQRPSGSLKPTRGPSYFFGMRYNYSGTIMSGDYENLQGGILKYSDHVTSTGSNLAFVFKMSGLLVKDATRKSKFKGGSKKPKIKGNKKDQSVPVKSKVNSRESQ